MKRIAAIFASLFCLWANILFAQKPLSDSNGEKFQIAVAMPFCGKQLMENPNHKNAAIGSACRQYYEGFILALDSFKKNEIPIEIKVYDTQRDTLVFKRILEKKDIINSDLIIGPVLKEGNEMMLGFCEKNKIYHVSPFLTLTKSKIENPYLISVYPDLSYYGNFILEDIVRTGDQSANIIVLCGKESNDKVLSASINSLKSKYPNYIFKNVEIGKYTDLKSAYKLGKINHIIVSSENEFLVNSALRFMADSNSFVDMQVYGLKKWLEFTSVNIAQYEQLKVKIISPFYFNYSDQNNKLFIEKYRERFFTEPNEYAVTGYEQATYFISSLIQQKGELNAIDKQEKNKPLSNWYLIARKPGGKSLQNNKLNILYFKDGRLERLVY